MKIERKQIDDKGVFYAGPDEKHVAEMTYSMKDPKTMTIEHTEVAEELRGQKVGNLLVEAAVNYARKNQIKIITLCPFAHAVFKRTREYDDVAFSKSS